MNSGPCNASLFGFSPAGGVCGGCLCVFVILSSAKSIFMKGLVFLNLTKCL